MYSIITLITLVNIENNVNIILTMSTKVKSKVNKCINLINKHIFCNKGMFYVSLGDDSIVIFLLAVASSSGSFSISTSSSKKTNSSRYTFINVCKINV